MKKKVIVIAGDPSSINSEIIHKSWKKINNKFKKRIFVLSSYDLLKDQFKQLGYNRILKKVNSIDEDINTSELKIIDVKLSFKKILLRFLIIILLGM